MGDIDIEGLRARYAPPPEPPPCRVCGHKLEIASMGGGAPTVFACPAAFAEGYGKWGSPEEKARREHYARSKHYESRHGDYQVIALLDALAAAQMERDQWRETAAHNDEVMRDYRDHAAAMVKRAEAAEARTRELEATVRSTVHHLKAAQYRADVLYERGDLDPALNGIRLSLEHALRGSDA